MTSTQIKSNPPLRVGIIGVGKHARQALIPAIEQIPDSIRIVALATGHEETAHAAEEHYRLPCYVGYEKLIIAPNVEALIIAGGKQEEISIAGLMANKPIFCETPSVTSETGAKKIRHLVEEKNLTYISGSCLRYSPIYQKMRNLLRKWREEEPGERTFNASYYFTLGHFSNLMLYLGGDINSVLHMQTPDGTGSVTLLKFASGDIGCLRGCNFNNWTIPYERVEIAHNAGLLLAENGVTLRLHHAPSKNSVHPYELSFDDASGTLLQTSFSIPYGQNQQLYLRGYVPELVEFAHCVKTGKSVVDNGICDALATFRVDTSIRKSAQAGGVWEKVPRD